MEAINNLMSEADFNMMKSLYCYGEMNEDDQYYKAILDVYGQEIVDEVEHWLKANFKVIYNVYTDHEGCTYNSLEERKKSWSRDEVHWIAQMAFLQGELGQRCTAKYMDFETWIEQNL